MNHTTLSRDTYSSLRHLALTAVLNTLIALLLTYLFRDDSFWTYFIISQCIGFSIGFLKRYSLLLLQPQSTPSRAATIIGTVLLGGLVGGFAGGWLTDIELSSLPVQKMYTIRIAVLSLLFGGILALYFYSSEQISEARQQLQEERIQRLTSEKQAVLSQLRILQAQIEPHFLFNTLANIHSLLDSDSKKGKRMLADLTRYLRATLAETRSSWTTLGNEMDLIASYLNIFQIRMDDRLQVHIEIEENLRIIPFSPMLIQPLVENALIHGLDETIEGGSIHIRVEQKKSVLRVSVIDTGKGFATDHSYGLGLTNIKNRLEGLYDGQARLLLSENLPTGIKAIIEVPYASTY